MDRHGWFNFSLTNSASRAICETAKHVILEVNVFTPGNLFSCCEMAGVNFAGKVLQSIERKLEIRKEFPGHFENSSLAVM